MANPSVHQENYWRITYNTIVSKLFSYTLFTVSFVFHTPAFFINFIKKTIIYNLNIHKKIYKENYLIYSLIDDFYFRITSSMVNRKVIYVYVYVYKDLTIILLPILMKHIIGRRGIG